MHEFLRANTKNYENFCTCVTEVRDPKKLLQVFGLYGHPAVQEAISRRKAGGAVTSQASRAPSSIALTRRRSTLT